ncbi:ABC transporter [Paeniglutamicibacter sp. ABSL32-1]|uniref:MetQ/NlpA family ABC transporter substrate-binding protein n=1 Tax=Paeniglutamicibacter quisquiliarum TaxID=2849498 RepID=UPI001C2D6278|nr:MetQ/NlpA family ABC transporter substrate-binding protein [Paeniglutamicibacter quisquiliarum]MBV1779585.1 ABC transporter [Paeniglutamicibacter quisquiliarum]
MRKKIALALTGAATLFALTACGGGTATAPSADVSATLDPANPTVVKVGASPVPHSQILEYIDENLAAKAGIDLDVTEIDDYQTPNLALSDGSIDANFFQHVPFFDEQVASKGYKLEHGTGILLEPLTAFSKKYDDAASVEDGAVVVLMNDPSNQVRGLRVLEGAGLLSGIVDGDSALTVESDEAKNPKHLKFQEVNAEQVPKFYQEDPSVGLAVVNGNFIVQAKLNKDEVLAVEPTENNPNANILAWREGEKTAAVAKLDELLHSDEVSSFIKTTWPEGDVIPAF